LCLIFKVTCHFSGVENFDQTEAFWEWWWDTKFEDGKISRPEIISDDDPILTETVGKDLVDLALYPEFWNEYLTEKVTFHKLVRWESLSRKVYRSFISRIVGANSIKLEGRPQLVFCGGGYAFSYTWRCG